MLSCLCPQDMFLLAAMGPPGGGRTNISRRLQSRFSLINMTFPQVHCSVLLSCVIADDASHLSLIQFLLISRVHISGRLALDEVLFRLARWIGQIPVYAFTPLP